MKMIHPVAAAQSDLIDPRWSLLLTGRATNSAFYYAVKTTGIFCRPGCRSRLPRRENVLFFGSPAEAVAAGYRACKRCQPDGLTPEQELGPKLTRACRELERGGTEFSVETLARSLGMSQSHFQRVFKHHLGLSPKQYQSLHRLQRFKTELRRQVGVTDAIYTSGFGSPARAYDNASRKLGMTPRAVQTGGKGEKLVYACAETGLGWLLIALTPRGVCAIELGNNPRELRQRLKRDFPHALLKEDPPGAALELRKLVRHLEKPSGTLNLPLDLRGTAFQLRVWKALQEIPPGETRTYQQLARAVGQPRAIRAAAAACAANKLALAIPCHRAIRSDGTLAGYKWGLKRKQIVLAIERKNQHAAA